MRDKLFVFECDEVKLVHHDIRMDGFQKIKTGDKYLFHVYFGMRTTIEVTLSDSNAQKLESVLMAKMEEDLKQDIKISKSYPDFLKKAIKGKVPKPKKN